MSSALLLPRCTGWSWFVAIIGVFIMDWSDHPEKTQAWYNEREARAIDDGLLHVFRQEVDHNYAACVEGVIIPAEWVKSSIDAHIKLRFEQHPNDDCCAGLDVADGGGDRNALAIREGVTLWAIEQWGERDTGVATRKASMVYKFTGVEVAEYRFSMISWRWLGCQGGVESPERRRVDARSKLIL